jgi:hypothetical protein
MISAHVNFRKTYILCHSKEANLVSMIFSETAIVETKEISGESGKK